MKNNKKKKAASPGTRITLFKTPFGAFVYTFERNPTRKIGISFEIDPVQKRAAKRVTQKKKETPKETPSSV